MNILYHMCIALSVGIIFGVIIGGIKSVCRVKSPSQKKTEFMKKLTDKFAIIFKYVTLTLLAVGLIWCSYFLLLGIMIPAQAGYADNMAELIVSVLTVISIIFAFVEFIRRKD